MPSTDSDQARVADHLTDEHLADFYALDALYTEAERRLRETTREYGESEVQPYIGDWW